MSETTHEHGMAGAVEAEVLGRIPNVAELWSRAEGDEVLDLRLRLHPDTWETRERAIDEMVELRRAHIGDMSINYSFTLPDVAFEDELVSSEIRGARVHSFV